MAAETCRRRTAAHSRAARAGPARRGLPFPWSIYSWIDGETATPARIGDLSEFAVDLAAFLVALRGADATGGPQPGRHNFYRGGPLTTYHDETLAAITRLGTAMPSAMCRRIWQDGLDAAWDGSGSGSTGTLPRQPPGARRASGGRYRLRHVRRR
ncbi:hypothetical protein NKG94_22535 [Micromonospora sp. M12]